MLDNQITITYNGIIPSIYKTDKYIIKLSDFDYENNNTIYRMHCDNKNSYGEWFLFKYSGEYVVSNNVWIYNVKQENVTNELEFIKKVKDITKLTKKYKILSSLDLLSEDVQKKVTEDCEKAILKWKNELFMNENSKVLLSCSTDCESLCIKITSKPQSIKNKSIIYEYVVGSCTGINTEYFDTEEKAFGKACNLLNSFYDDLSNNFSVDTMDNEMLTISLMCHSKDTLNNMINKANEYGLLYCTSKLYQDYLKESSINSSDLTTSQYCFIITKTVYDKLKYKFRLNIYRTVNELSDAIE
jgi:ribosomal protein L24E